MNDRLRTIDSFVLEFVDSEPEGITALSRWLSGAIPPAGDRSADRIPAGMPARNNAKAGIPAGMPAMSAAQTGGVAALNRRLIAGSPAGLHTGSNSAPDVPSLDWWRADVVIAFGTVVEAHEGPSR